MVSEAAEVLWEVEEAAPSHPAMRIRKGLLTRGRKRDRAEWLPGQRVYVVLGEARFSDSRDQYFVRWASGAWHCTCMEGVGGEYRVRGCSHIGAVLVEITERGGVDPWGITGEAATGDGEDARGLAAERGPAREEVAGVTASDLLPSLLPPPSDSSFWGHPPFPSWVSGFRPHQEQAFVEIIEAFEGGARAVVVDAPTGSGKTLLAEMVRRGLKSPRMTFTCTTKSLQEQILRDFDYARMLKGRANYPTASFPHLFDDGAWGGTNCGDCEAKSRTDACSLCPSVDECPYVAARTDATLAPVAVLNSAYLLREWQGEKSRFRDVGLTVIDEADELEAALMGVVEVAISPRRQAKLGIGPPDRKTVEESWAQWLEVAIPAVGKLLGELRPKAKGDRHVRREVKFYEGLRRNLDLMREEVGEGLWVYDGGNDGWIRFKPVKVDRFGQGFIWAHDTRFLLMSASVVSAQEMAESLGLGDDEWAEVQVPSTFPVANRLIYPAPVANVTAKNKQAAYPALAEGIRNVLALHPDERVLVHTVSFDLTRYLFERLAFGVDGRKMLAYLSAADRAKALEGYIKTEGAVLLAPSFERGIDLPDDLCRVVVIAKCPFPYLGDKQVSARLHSKGGQLWYSVATVRSIVQMTGRGVRHKDDSCTTYILDGVFLTNIWKKSRRLIPSWWREAVTMDGNIHRAIKKGTS